MGVCCEKKTMIGEEVCGVCRPKKTWREIVEKDCQAHGLNMKDAHIRWMTQIRDD